MAKKKNPEQETEQPTEEQQEQEIETGTEEAEEETQEQETAPETEDESEDQDEDPEKSDDSEEERPTEEQQEEVPPTGSDENAALRRTLLQAQGKLAAYAVGVAPDMIDDAVTLAMAEAAKSGEVTEAAVIKAMDAVLKRHPEWKTAPDKKKAGGFKLGADRDGLTASKKNTGNATQNVKRWNRFK